jgi:hypothetical protein
MIRYRFLLLASLVLASLGLLAAAARANSVPKPKNDPATEKTIHDVRTVGTAMWHWYKDQMASHPANPHAGAAEPTTADFTPIPAISREDLAKILVPKYIPAIPEKDGWGHPYEFRLNTHDLDGEHVMAVRSTGRDGGFSGDSYAISAFPPADKAQDIAWIDGYFARWPDLKK